MKPNCILEERKSRTYHFGFVEYDPKSKMYRIDPVGQEEFGPINADVDNPLDGTGEIYAVLDGLKEDGFDCKVDYILVDDTCIFLRDKNGSRISVELTEWDKVEKHIFDQPDIRDLIDLPRSIYPQEVYFFIFDDGVDDEDGIFEWGVFYPMR